MFDRIISLIGEDNLNKIREKKILVLGVGGVGGYVCEDLVRSGIENITIIDKDIVDKSNLNRQIIALNSTIGMSKVKVMKERLENINANVKVTIKEKEIKEDDVKSLGLENYDFVVDAVDDVKVKVELCKYALEHNVELVMSTGTAKKLHPEKLKMISLDKTEYDPLAKKMRMALRGYNTKKLTVLASDEAPVNVEDNKLGSMIFVPASGGLLIASYIINKIIDES